MVDRRSLINYYKMLKIFIFFHSEAPSACKGGSPSGKICDGKPYDRSCCTREAPCSTNQGDCDKSDQCQGNLVCGQNNCPASFPKYADCCESPNGAGEKI